MTLEDAARDGACYTISGSLIRSSACFCVESFEERRGDHAVTWAKLRALGAGP